MDTSGVLEDAVAAARQLPRELVEPRLSRVDSSRKSSVMNAPPPDGSSSWSSKPLESSSSASRKWIRGALEVTRRLSSSHRCHSFVVV